MFSDHDRLRNEVSSFLPAFRAGALLLLDLLASFAAVIQIRCAFGFFSVLFVGTLFGQGAFSCAAHQNQFSDKASCFRKS
jgi:hypothetical protein